MSKKRALDNFFTPTSHKKIRPNSAEPIDTSATSQASSAHPSYPYPIPHFPAYIEEVLAEVPASEGKPINDQPDLDLLYFQPYIPPTIERELYEFLRTALFFYRVNTTVFGVDATSTFSPSGTLLDSSTSNPIPSDRYTCRPRPLPQCLDSLRRITEVFTSSTYNFCLVNYYATGTDSISYHSDDERFLGPLPSIASFSLGAKRDFLMKHKPVPPSAATERKETETISDKPLKIPLNSGDMILMRGSTQPNWLHSIPKRKGAEAEKGRINITFRKAVVKGGTENYYRYNVGDGGVYKWDAKQKKMVEWNPMKMGDTKPAALYSKLYYKSFQLELQIAKRASRREKFNPIYPITPTNFTLGSCLHPIQPTLQNEPSSQFSRKIKKRIRHIHLNLKPEESRYLFRNDHSQNNSPR
ncbi:MAG: hypothetical protein Q9191_005532, partial [Dirinaria sp. TL-2023a]